MYRETASRLSSDLELARRFGFTLSLKLVRGAYVNLERQLAAAEGAEPLQTFSHIEETHKSYDACMRLLFENLPDVQVFLGT